MENTLLSIILPTYNGSKWLKKALESVQNQSYQDWELLVIDDGSTDNTAQIVANFTQNDPRIRYIKNEVNLGIQKSLNKGLKEAKGEYIARIDDDDFWIDKEKLEKQMDFINKNPECVLLGTGVVIVNEKGSEILRYLNPANDKELKAKIFGKNYFIHSSVVFNKDIALKVGGYGEGEDTRHFEDYDLWLRMGSYGTFANLPIYAVAYMVRDDSISSKNRVYVFRKLLLHMKKYKNKYKNYYIILVLSYLRFFIYSIYVKFFNKLPLNKILRFYKEL